MYREKMSSTRKEGKIEKRKQENRFVTTDEPAFPNIKKYL